MKAHLRRKLPTHLAVVIAALVLVLHASASCSGSYATEAPTVIDAAVQSDSSPSDSGALGTDSRPSDSGPFLDRTAPEPLVGCARYPTASFCEDFESASSLTIARWTRVPTSNPPNTNVALTSLNVTSPSNAVVFETVQTQAPCTPFELVKAVPGTPNRLSLRADLRAQYVGSYLSVRVGKPGAERTISVTVSEKGLGVVVVRLKPSDAGISVEISTESITLNAGPLGRFVSVSLDLERFPQELSLDAEGFKKTIELGPDFAIEDAQVAIGAGCAEARQRATFDDVAVITTQ